MAVVTSCDPFQAAEGADAGGSTQSPRKIGKTGKEVTPRPASHVCHRCGEAFERAQQEM